MTEHLDLIAAKIQAMKNRMERDLHAEIFTCPAGMLYVPPESRGQKIQRVWWRVRGYLSTLWLALKGADD